MCQFFCHPKGLGQLINQLHMLFFLYIIIYFILLAASKKKKINRKSKPHNFVLCYYRIKDYLIRENQIVTKNVLSTNRLSYPFIVFGNVNL